MEKGRIDFIADLLADKRISTAFKEKAFELAGKEIQNVLHIENENREKILEIEKKITVKEEGSYSKTCIVVDEQQIKEVQPLRPAKPAPPNPLHTKNFLTYFRDGEGLKYLTHDYKDLRHKITREDLIKIAKKEFEEAKENYPQTSIRLIRRVEEFAFKESPDWTITKGRNEEHIHIGWSAKEFVLWEKNSNVHPCKDSRLNKEMIEPFKRTIEVRDGILLDVVNESIDFAFTKEDFELFEFQYDKDNLMSGRFFTDVDRFGQALYRILSCIKDKGEKHGNYNISILYDEVDNLKIVKIVHHNSKPNCSSEFKFSEGGDFGEIRSNLWSLCNWAIEAEFTNGCRRKYLLYDSSIQASERDKELNCKEIEGFSYILYFY